MRQMKLCLILLMTTVPVVLAQQPTKLIAPDNSFEASFPGEFHHEQNTSESGKVHIETHSYSFETSESKFILTYLDLSPPPVDLKAADAIDSAIGGTVDNVKGRLLTERILTMSGKPAKAAVISVGESTIIEGRFVYVNPRLYQLLVLHKTGVTPPFQERFFDSFLLRTTAAPPPPVWTDEKEAFALGDDEIGESFSSFVSHHPKARCVDSTASTKSCYQWLDISIYGMSAHSDPACSTAIHASASCIQGLSAQFKNQHLTLLSYAVEGSDKRNAVAALMVKYGTPGIDNSGATIWSDGGDELSISVNKATEDDRGPTLVTIMIMRP